jgi:hypothetical protein
MQLERGAAAMKSISTIVLSIAAAILPALAQDTVPDAMRPAAVGDTFVPSLGEIMGGTQLRHFKLWYAGQQENWELASYELGQIEDSFFNAARLYRNIPVEKINMIDKPLAALDSAVKAKDGKRFAAAFKDLTTTCNGCHQAAHVGFIMMQIPTSSPFSNQSFTPKSK